MRSALSAGTPVTGAVFLSESPIQRRAVLTPDSSSSLVAILDRKAFSPGHFYGPDQRVRESFWKVGHSSFLSNAGAQPILEVRTRPQNRVSERLFSLAPLLYIERTWVDRKKSQPEQRTLCFAFDLGSDGSKETSVTFEPPCAGPAQGQTAGSGSGSGGAEDPANPAVCRAVPQAPGHFTVTCHVSQMFFPFCPTAEAPDVTGFTFFQGEAPVTWLGYPVLDRPSMETLFPCFGLELESDSTAPTTVQFDLSDVLFPFRGRLFEKISLGRDTRAERSSWVADPANGPRRRQALIPALVPPTDCFS